MKKEYIEFMAEVHRQIAEKADMSKPFPQDIDIELEMNLIADKPRRNGILITGVA